MKSSFLSFLVCTCLAASSAFAAVINVPGDFWVIQEAINAAVDGDTVMIAPGVYYENMRMSHRSLSIIGSGGVDNPNTIIKPDSAYPILWMDSNSDILIQGLTFDSARLTAIHLCCTRATIRDNVFRYNAWGNTAASVILLEEQLWQIPIENNLFHNNNGTCIRVTDAATAIIGNTFVNNQAGIQGGGFAGSTVIENNIIANSTGFGIYGLYTDPSCNNVYNNSPDYSTGSSPGPGDFSDDPVFCNADSLDFHLADESSCAPGFNSCSVLVGAFPVACVGCNDFDGDSLCSYEDNCPNVYNPDQSDIDGDGRGDVCDGCPTIPNESPLDFDGDAIPNDCDNCLWTSNPSQIDSDSDGWGDECDYCVGFPCSTYCTPNPGAWDGNGGFDILDLLRMLTFLYFDSAGPPNPMNVDVDGMIGITPNDLMAMHDHLFGGAPSFSCPPTNPQSVLIDSALRIEHVDSVSPGQTSLALQLKLRTPLSLSALSLPMRIRIGIDVPVLDSVVDGPEFGVGYFSVYPSWDPRIIPDSGEVLISAILLGYSESIQPGSYTVATLYLSFPSAPVSRPVSITWTQFGPKYPQQFSYDVIYNAIAVRKHYVLEPFAPQYEPLLVPTNCCVGIRGNVDGRPDNIITISDLTYMVAYMFGGGPQPCLKEGNVNGSGDGSIDISDLTFLVAYMFGGGPAPPACP